MNILIVSAMFPPIQTGTSFYTKNLANAFQKAGHKVTLVTVSNQDSVYNHNVFKLYYLKAWHFPLKNYFKHLRITALFPSNYFKLSGIVRKENPDLILLINHYLDIAFPTIYASRKNKIPLVISVGTQLQSLNPFRQRILNILDKIICGGLIFPYCCKIIAWDREILRYLKNTQGSKILEKSVIVGYSVNGKIEDFARYKHNYHRTNQIIGIGAIIEQRNFIFLIHLFNELLKFNSQLKLKIIGHVYYDATLKLINKLNLSKKVELTGELPHRKVLMELEKSVFYWGAASGQYVGLGLATLEAMLMGVPVVSNVPKNILGKPYLRDMENIILSNDISVAKTFPKIKLLLSDWQLRQKIGQNGQKLVMKYMNWNVVAKDMAEIFQKIIIKRKT
ncbi:MAG: glycosyltransferase family 4 protein [Patescibacteria group bacterium]|nr:glycosyltransferase family 4 protein [Patescibacteria group bacterium]